MSAVKSYQELDKNVMSKCSPCPVEERVCETYDVPDAYAPGTKKGKEGEITDDSGITRQKCGGGYRVVRKKIGGT